MEELQSAGLVALFWTETGGTSEVFLGETPQGNTKMLSILENQIFYNTKFAGNNPTESRTQTGEITFEVDLIETDTIKNTLMNTIQAEGTLVIGGLYNNKRAKTGKLRLHPLYNGKDKSEDVTLLKTAVSINDERSYIENGQKVLKCMFRVMGSKTDLATATTDDFEVTTPVSSDVEYRMVYENDLGTTEASSSTTGDSTDSSITFDVTPGATRVIFWKSTDSFAANASYYRLSQDEIDAGEFDPSGASWTASSPASLPVDNSPYFYKAYEIGV